MVESVKAASEVYTPVAGEVVEPMPSWRKPRRWSTRTPQGRGWFFKVKIAEPAELEKLMDETAYTALVAAQG